MESESIVLKEYEISFFSSPSLRETIEFALPGEKRPVFIVTDSNLADLYFCSQYPHYVLTYPGEHNKCMAEYEKILERMISLNLD